MGQTQHEVLVEALSRPEAYSERPPTVTVRETHMSWVFITDQRAYKLKKPLHYSYLDFSTADARRVNCEREVRLNRRFTTDVYRGVGAASLLEGGAVEVGSPVPGADDWLVVMKRLDETQSLEAALEKGWATPAMLPSAVALLREGYSHRPAPRLDAFGYVNRLWRQVEADAADLKRPLFGLDGARVDGVRRGCLTYLARHAGVVAGRVRDGRLVEGHGDLRPEHIFLNDRPRIVDCLEFNRRLRLLDPFDELACLSLHCERLGGDWVRSSVFDAYAELTGDVPDPLLVSFYLAYRGLLWARLSILHLERSAADVEHWRAKADAYMAIAAREADRLSATEAAAC